MNIVICIKAIKKDIVYGNEKRNETYVINPYDRYALQELSRIKGNCRVVCICMGENACSEVLLKSLAIAADEAILLSDKAFAGSDTVATSYILSKAIEKIGDVSMIICGEKSVDGETGQVSSAIAARLGYTKISGVESICSLGEDDAVVVCERNNHLEKILFSYPCVISLNGFTTVFDNLSLIALKRAKKKRIQVWGAEEIQAELSCCGILGSKTQVLHVEKTILPKEQTCVEGTSIEKADFIIGMMSKGCWK